MPYSSDSGKAYVERLVRRRERYVAEPAKTRLVLDLGIGSGTYEAKFRKLLGPSSWTGIEIFEPYVKQFALDKRYEKLILNDIEAALDEIAHRPTMEYFPGYDYVFIGDVLEHMPRDKAKRVVQLARGLMVDNGVMFCSVPIGEYPQGEYLGNPHEAHVDTWHDLAEVERELPSVRATHQEREIGIGVICSTDTWEVLSKPRLAVYMICKNEEAFIGRALASALEADEIVVADTGSTDKTVDCIDKALASHPCGRAYEIHVDPWRFDDARNASLSFVSNDIDYCVSLDADELLAPGFIDTLRKWLKALPQASWTTRVHHSFETHWNWQQADQQPSVTKHYHERIHSRHGYKWVHPVHEKLVRSHCDAETIGWCTDLLMRQLPDTTKSRSSYGPLLEQAVLEDPKDWKLWSFLVGERSAAGNIDGALQALDQCFALADSDKTFLYLRQGELNERLKRYDAAAKAFKSACIMAPTMREVHTAEAEYHERRGDSKASRAAYGQALSCTHPTSGYMRREDCWDGRLETKINSLG